MIPTYYVINFTPVCHELKSTDKIFETISSNQVYLKEDASPYFSDIWNANLTISYLRLKYPQHVYWITAVMIKHVSNVAA